MIDVPVVAGFPGRIDVNGDEMMMRDSWSMMPMGGLFMILLFVFLLLGIAAYIKYLFFTKR